MKKLLAIILAMLMLVSLSTAAFAESDYYSDYYDGSSDSGFLDMAFPESGVTLHVPWSLLVQEGAPGTISPMIAQEMGYHSGIYLTKLMYERYEEVFNPDACVDYLTFLCVRDDYDEEQWEDPDLQALIPQNEIFNIGSVGNYTFYLIIGATSIPDALTPEEVNWYNYLLDNVDEILDYTEIYEPTGAQNLAGGQHVSFETTDFDGNPVTSEEIFSANRVTMLNIWETGCGPCRGELGELAQLHLRFQEMGCGIVGLLWDSDMPGAIEEAEQLLSEAGVTYPSIQIMSNFDELFPIEGYPTSYFIDSNGTILDSIEGAMVDFYETAMENALNRAGEIESGSYDNSSDYDYASSQDPFEDSIESSDYAGNPVSAPVPGTPYRVICVDENGNRVQGATIQFCSDDQCMMGKTDSNGIAEFDEAPGHYIVHLLKVPEGYAPDSREYNAPQNPDDIIIVVKAA